MLECKTALTEEEKEAILHQRYSIFVDEFKFFAPREDGREIEYDRYDEYSLLLGVWKKGILVGSCRLVLPNDAVGLPTLNVMRIDSEKLLHDERTAEISRITVNATYRTFKKTIKVLQIMQQKIDQIASDHNILQLIGAVEPSFLRLLNYAALPYQPIGPIQYLIGAERIPVLLTLKENP
ncbi:GNAT family N-acetyltransferase [Sulfuricurvum sp.]|uniref:acyl-homoserine-lactone synthase n=1 Tax=Sulfuricurvum sp. TaxID=2025608 RepID=UPI002E31512F|nr:GNAT family N-acetyltransferase [Sulfuricurvum sp.]HEX5330289.1 GNAT family N-acetyltransferase [Sulfuricurvum sp.]